MYYVFYSFILPVPPSITQDENEFTAMVTSPVQLPCEASGVPSPELEWKRDGSTLMLESNTHVILPNGALRIHEVRKEDGGIYECIATSMAGNATKLVTLTVQGE